MEFAKAYLDAQAKQALEGVADSCAALKAWSLHRKAEVRPPLSVLQFEQWIKNSNAILDIYI